MYLAPNGRNFQTIYFNFSEEIVRILIEILLKVIPEDRISSGE